MPSSLELVHLSHSHRRTHLVNSLAHEHSFHEHPISLGHYRGLSHQSSWYADSSMRQAVFIACDTPDPDPPPPPGPDPFPPPQPPLPDPQPHPTPPVRPPIPQLRHALFCERRTPCLLSR